MGKFLNEASGANYVTRAITEAAKNGAEELKDVTPEDLDGIKEVCRVLMGEGFKRGVISSMMVVGGAVIGYGAVRGYELLLKTKLKKIKKKEETEESEEAAE